jgi:hypothetical protein
VPSRLVEIRRAVRLVEVEVLRNLSQLGRVFRGLLDGLLNGLGLDLLNRPEGLREWFGFSGTRFCVLEPLHKSRIGLGLLLLDRAQLLAELRNG